MIRSIALSMLLLCLAASAWAQDYSAMNGTYVSEYGGQVTLTYEGEGTASVHVDDGDLFMESYANLNGERLLAVYNENNEAQFLIFYGQDYLIIAPSSQKVQQQYPMLPAAYARTGSSMDASLESLWLTPNAHYANDQGTLDLAYEGEGSALVTLATGDCTFQGYGGTMAGRALQVYDDSGNLALMVFYENDIAVAVPLAAGVCDSLYDHLFLAGNGEPDPLQGYFDQNRANAPQNYFNALGRVTLTPSGEGQGQAEIVTENCDFDNVCYFFPPHVASIIHYQTHETLALIFHTDEYALVFAVNPDFCQNGRDFWDPFFSDGKTRELAFMEPSGLFQDQEGNSIRLTYFGEGMVEIQAQTQSCSFILEGNTFMNHGIAIYDDMSKVQAVLFYEQDYVVFKSINPQYCEGDPTVENIYQRVE